MPAPVEIATELDDHVVAHARATLERALPAELRDDRFDDGWVRDVQASGAPFVAALYGGGGGTLGFLGGPVQRGRLRLEALVAPTEDDDEARILDQLLRAVLPLGPRTGAEALELWAHPAWPFHEAVAVAHDLVEVRALHQLRCSLPVDADPLPTRAFRPGIDDEAVLAVNNRAFHDHPDQGGWSLEDFRANIDEPWFDPDGLRVHERDGRVIGFCWTKVHRRPDLGEIYVIGVDPDFHGQGLGVPMTAAGLHWLSDHGLDTGMLYVEADNAPALRTYERLGFVRFRTDRAWARALG